MSKKVSKGLREQLKDRNISYCSSWTQPTKEDFDRLLKNLQDSNREYLRQQEQRRKIVNQHLKDIGVRWSEVPDEMQALYMTYVSSNRAWGAWYLNYLKEKYPKFFNNA